MLKHIVIILLLQYIGYTQADIIKCVDSNGKVSYSDQACRNTAKQTVISNTSETKEKVGLGNWPIKPLTFNVKSYSYQLVFAVYFFMSVVCYVAYRMDKSYALTGRRRISENRLHMFELLGGWPGGFIAQRFLRHKNRKLSYQLVFWLIAILHVLVWADFLLPGHALFSQLKHYLVIS